MIFTEAKKQAVLTTQQKDSHPLTLC